jgi:hypothetical protein
MTNQTAVTVVEGPKGKAEIFELWSPGKAMEYEVHFNGQVQTYKSLGEAYIEAGEKTGTKT